MAKFEVVPLAELKTRIPGKLLPLVDELKGNLGKLRSDQGGKLKLEKGKEPSTSGSVMKGEVYVAVTGQLFYDDAHVGTPPRGKKGCKAETLWEIHPITSILPIGLTPKHTTGRSEWARAAPPSPPMGSFGVSPIGTTSIKSAAAH